MRGGMRSIVVGLWAMMAGLGNAWADEAASTQPATDSGKEAAMAAMQQLGSPGEAHKALKPLAGRWIYAAQWWTSPEAAPQSMTGTATNTLIFGGRFLRQEIRGEAEEGRPPFKGLGFVGYDNMRKEYQSVWFDNMITGMMWGTGQFDATTRTMTDQGDFSCPITGETHRHFRTTWRVIDQNHNKYENYMSTPDGREFKSMEIRYTRAQ